MHDLDMVRELLTTDDPTADAVDRSRHQLHNRMLGMQRTRSRTRTRLLVAGTGVVAAAVAAVVVITSTSGPADSPVADQPATRTVPAQQVLLAAATTADQSPDGHGKYWHVKVTESNGTLVYNDWTAPNGDVWTVSEKTGGKPFHRPMLNDSPFQLPGIKVTLDQLRALPTDPAALKAWIADALVHSDARTSAGKLTADDRKLFATLSLVSLVSTVPAPPEVRAAAFRALATDPDVRDGGEVPGGHALLIKDTGRLVVDPKTGRINGTTILVTAEGALMGMGGSNTASIEAGWTDTLPK